jgi:hypothetical protein
MLIREFAGDDPLRVKLTSITRQMMARRRDTNATEPMSVRSFLNLLSDNDINVTKDDLFDMIKRAPLKNIIDNIQGDNLVFKGEHGRDNKADVESDREEKTLDRMAKRAATK